MSELMTTKAGRGHFRWHLLSTVSAVTLWTLAGAGTAGAEDSGRPTVWIELGGQLERVDGGLSPFAPAFLTSQPRPAVEQTSPLAFQRPPRYSNGAEGKITFAPEGSDWVMSASLRYGRSNRDRRVHEEMQSKKPGVFGAYKYGQLYADSRVKNAESHLISDFQVGRDVGIGVVGPSGHSELQLGLRFAQFTTKSDAAINELPVYFGSHYWNLGARDIFLQNQQVHRLVGNADRSFRGIGPAVSWEGDAKLVGGTDTAKVTVDWGVNAAVLFGRQKSQGTQDLDEKYYKTTVNNFQLYYDSDRYQHHTPFNRSRSVVVPNVGGFAALSFRYDNAKVTLGYRGDFFFNAMDGGALTRDTRDRSFHGPFATIAIGLGG
jgi:hypothetical protein